VAKHHCPAPTDSAWRGVIEVGRTVGELPHVLFLAHPVLFRKPEIVVGFSTTMLELIEVLAKPWMRSIITCVSGILHRRYCKYASYSDRR